MAVVSFFKSPVASRTPTQPPIAPPPRAEWLPTVGGGSIYSCTVLPERDAVAGVFFVLGPEISARPLYPSLAAALRTARIATSLVHPRGTGYSPGPRGDLEDYRWLLADHHTGLAQLQRRLGSKPVFLFGHSVGAALALELAAAANGPRVAGLVLVNPAFRLRDTEGMTPSLGEYLRFGADMILRPATLTVDMNRRPSAIVHAGDRAEAEAMQADPLVVRYFSMRFLMAQRGVMNRCAKNAARTAAPVLLIQGARDALVDPRGNDEILAALVDNDKVRLVAPEAGHGSSAVETMVEPVLDWLEARVRSSQSERHLDRNASDEQAAALGR